MGKALSGELSFSVLFCVLPLHKQFVGISVLKIILSHVHKRVISGVILQKSFFPGKSLSGVPAWQMGKHYPQIQCFMTLAVLSMFGVKTKIAPTGVQSIIKESLTKQLIQYFNFTL